MTEPDMTTATGAQPKATQATATASPTGDTGDTGDKKAAETAGEESLRQELKAQEQKARSALKKIAETVHESDSTPVGALTLRKILGGDILTAEMVRSQIWLFVLIVVLTVAYVAIRYQCQQDMIQIDKMERELVDAKYKSLSSSSILTERCRESHVLEMLRNNSDSLLKPSERPPYIINVPED